MERISKIVLYIVSCKRTMKAHMANGDITVNADATDDEIVYFCADVVGHTDLGCMAKCVEASSQPGAKEPTVARKKGQPALTDQEKDDLRIEACFTKCPTRR